MPTEASFNFQTIPSTNLGFLALARRAGKLRVKVKFPMWESLMRSPYSNKIHTCWGTLELYDKTPQTVVLDKAFQMQGFSLFPMEGLIRPSFYPRGIFDFSFLASKGLDGQREFATEYPIDRTLWKKLKESFQSLVNTEILPQFSDEIFEVQFWGREL